MALTSTARLLFSFVILIAGITACKKSQPQPEPATKDTASLSAQPLAVYTILTVRRDTSMEATDTTHTFGIRDTIHGIIQTRNATDGLLLSGRWYYAETGQKIAENSARLSAGTNLSHFDLMNANPWVAGSYKLMVLIDGVPKDSVSFAIENRR